MKVLFAVWELDPFFKFGGLGDIALSLPYALKKQGVDIGIIMPFYKAMRLGKIKREKVSQLTVAFDQSKERVKVYLVYHPETGVPVYLVKNRRYLDIVKRQDTFAFFDQAVVEILKRKMIDFIPQIIHCNDHHTGFIPLLVRKEKLDIKTLLTIHNLSHQGETSIAILEKMGIDKTKCRVIAWEIKSKKVNFLLEGIAHADIINTVSPAYAQEIFTEEYGAGLEAVLKGREANVFGILNGIDVESTIFHHQKNVTYPYLGGNAPSSSSKKIYGWRQGKKLNKRLLQRKLGLSIKPEIPLFGFIGRLSPSQKGMNIMHMMMRRVDLDQFQFVILGKGDENWERRFQWLTNFYSKSIAGAFTYDEALAYQIYAGSDFILIPSKFEPCGLIQMLAMIHGTIPIAHKTGGLKDTIVDNVNGFLFEKYTSVALEKEVKKAARLYHQDKKRLEIIVAGAMSADFSWEKSAGEYVRLYEKLIRGEY